MLILQYLVQKKVPVVMHPTKLIRQQNVRLLQGTHTSSLPPGVFQNIQTKCKKVNQVTKALRRKVNQLTAAAKRSYSQCKHFSELIPLSNQRALVTQLILSMQQT